VIQVNGQVRQKDFTKNMHYKLDELISYISQFMKLDEGDLILTGTPNGVGPVKGGDHLEAFARIGDKVVAKMNFEVTY
jgi:acylpyruvate hydrolase